VRLRPALHITLRYAAKDFIMNGLLVPSGTAIVVYVNAIYKRDDAFADPLQFDPRRFIDKRPEPNTWLPFGGGAHRCLGAAFAMFESRVLLRTILAHRHFAPDTSPGEREDQHRSTLTLPTTAPASPCYPAEDTHAPTSARRPPRRR
jgi:cytochrome P450